MSVTILLSKIFYSLKKAIFLIKNPILFVTLKLKIYQCCLSFKCIQVSPCSSTLNGHMHMSLQ